MGSICLILLTNRQMDKQTNGHESNAYFSEVTSKHSLSTGSKIQDFCCVLNMLRLFIFF